jgi:predicted nucleic acid-binding protein
MAQNSAARAVIKMLSQAKGPWAIAWPCLNEFLAVVTRPKYFLDPTPMSVAVAQIKLWSEAPNISFLGYSNRHLMTLTQILQYTGWVGSKVHDANIASICVDHDVDEIWTTDSSFFGLQMLKARNPFAI